MKKLFFFTSSLIVLCFVNLTFAQETSAEKLYEFKGVVKDQNSAVLAGTNLFFNGKDKRYVAPTNTDGEFTTKLSAGTYEVTINKDISSDFVAFIEIRENAINPNNVEFVIKTNPICCGQTANKMYPRILSFPKPPYPAAAKAVRATGEVVVTVKIDKEGKVTSANAESGHPLLRKAAEQWAKRAVFEVSEKTDEREAKLTFVFLSDGDYKLKHYTNSYRTEISYVAPAVDY
jgi:TonB family protein